MILLSCFISDISLFSPSEFLAEDSQEKFWNFVEASQNIGSSDHHGKIEANISLTLVSGKIRKIGLFRVCVAWQLMENNFIFNDWSCDGNQQSQHKLIIVFEEVYNYGLRTTFDFFFPTLVCVLLCSFIESGM